MALGEMSYTGHVLLVEIIEDSGLKQVVKDTINSFRFERFARPCEKAMRKHECGVRRCWSYWACWDRFSLVPTASTGKVNPC